MKLFPHNIRLIFIKVAILSSDQEAATPLIRLRNISKVSLISYNSLKVSKIFNVFISFHKKHRICPALLLRTVIKQVKLNGILILHHTPWLKRSPLTWVS